MTSPMTARRLRWALPGVVAAGIAVAAVTTNGAGASEQPNLPPKSAAQLLAAVRQAHPAHLSGTVVETARLGLPNLPSAGMPSSGGLSPQSLLTGSHTMRVWYAGPEQQRIALLAPMSERDVIHDGSHLWSYTSTTNTVTEANVGTMPRLGSRADLSRVTPQQAAEQALRAIDPTTNVTVDRTARVAGRPAYQLDLVPRDSRSLVGSVRIAIDAATSTPLQVQIYPAGSATPALQLGFTDVSFSAPSPSVFHFVPPAGATVSHQRLGSSDVRQHGSSLAHRQDEAVGDHSKVLGTGWTSVVEMSAGHAFTGSNAGLLDRLSTAVPGGRLITTSLLSVLVTQDGHVFAGPVNGTDLQHVAATGQGL